MKLKAWIEAMRLRTLPVSVAGVLAAVAYAIADGAFNAAAAAICLIFALLCQIASNFANEYFDYKAGRDKPGRQGPRRGVTEGDIKPVHMFRATYLVLCLAALAGLTLTYWGGTWLIFVGIAIALGVFAYSAGPWPLSTHCLGEVGVIVFFGLVPVNFTYYVQTLHWSGSVVLGSVAIGLMIANVLIVNNYRDRADDAAVDKHTLATALPARAMPVLYMADALAAAALTLPLWHRESPVWFAVPALYLAAAAFVAVRMTRLTGRRLTPLLGITSILVFLYSVMMVAAACCR